MQKSITYSWRGPGSMSLNLSIDDKNKEVQFEGGRDQPRINSSFTTSDQAIQKAIEETNLYRKGLISERSSKVIEPESKKEEAKKVVETPKTTEEKSSLKGKFTSVKTIQQAADKLHEKYEVPLNELNSPDAILAKADALGASFPNLVM